MEVLHVFEKLSIQSHKGLYSVNFKKSTFSQKAIESSNNFHFIIDKKVADLYSKNLKEVLKAKSVLIIKAKERNKTLDKFTEYVEHLVFNNIRRGHLLVAIGGGIIQDITCFLSATILRGVPWIFYPTTLLAQTDSCIGSKSSINVGNTKNILGTYTPPQKIIIDVNVLKTLNIKELRSGIGEMLKVHRIDSQDSFMQIASDYHQLLVESSLLETYILKSLKIKKKLIEIDEFDSGPRNIMNFGHSFGHAIETASNFIIPHGIAVTIGIDMANYTAYRFGLTNKDQYDCHRSVLKANYSGYCKNDLSKETFFQAISKDKKNNDHELKLILPDTEGKLTAKFYQNDMMFRSICTDFFNKEFSN